MIVFCKRTVKRRSLILPLGSGADLQPGSEQMCAPIQANTCVHTRHTAAVDPDLHPMVLASAGEGADGVAGLGNICILPELTLYRSVSFWEELYVCTSGLLFSLTGFNPAAHSVI